MNVRPLLFASAIGLAVGIAAGGFTPLTGGGREVADLPPAQRGIHPVAAVPDATVRLAFPGDDGRIARVFSAFQQPVRLLQRFELREALQDVTAAELPALVKHAASSSEKARFELLEALVERWFELDPSAAQTWARTSSMDWNTIQLWGRADPEGAFRAAAELDGQWASRLLVVSLEGLCGEDTAAQLAKARTLPPGQLRDNVFSQLIIRRAGQDPSAAYASLEELPVGNRREQARYYVLQQWAGREPAGALAMLGELLPTLKAGAMGNGYVTDAVERIASENPQLVLDWLTGIPPQFRMQPAIAAARQWASKEPIPALEWCLANGVEIARPRYRGPGWQSPVLEEAMKRAPTETFALLEAMPPGADRDRLFECAFVASLQQMEGDGLKGAGWSLFQLLPEEAQILNVTSLGRARAKQGNLEDLGAWVQNFPPGQARSNAVTGAIEAASYRDPVHGTALLASLTTAADRDAGLRGLALFAPAEAASRALEITDAVRQKEVLTGLIVPWLKHDPAATRKWLDGATAVPAAWKQEWLQRR